MKVPRGFLLLAAASFLTPTSIASAQEFETQAEEDERRGIEEIVITSERRETVAQSTGVAISAFTGTDLDDQGYYNFEDISFNIPNVQFGRTLVGSGGVTIRGVSSSAGDRSTAFHVDGIYINAGGAAEAITFFDIQRVEVLRGPQGTLYGRNATGGSINVITNKPGPDFETFGDFQFGSYDEYLGRLAINIPILDEKLFSRTSLLFNQRDGFQRNIATPIRNHDADDADTFAIRQQLRWLPTDNLDLTVRYNYSQRQGVGPAQKVLNPFPLITQTGPLLIDLYCQSAAAKSAGCDISLNPTDVREIALDFIGRADNWSNSVNGQLVWDVPEIPFIGETEFKVLGSWTNGKSFGTSDQDGSDGKIVNTFTTVETTFNRVDDGMGGTMLVTDTGCSVELLIAGASEVDAGCTFGHNEGKEYVAEAQWASAGTGNSDWVIGLFYLNASSFANGLASTFPLTFVVSPPLGAGLSATQIPVFTSSTASASSIAAFGQGSYTFGSETETFMDNWTLAAGLRFTHDKKAATRQTPEVTLFGFPIQAEIDNAPSDSYDAWTGMLRADWQWAEDNFAYVVGSRGYKAGTLNTGLFDVTDPTSTQAPARPEYIWSFEAGSKNRFFDNRLQANMTGFYYHYDDLQVSVLANISVITLNAARATVWGLEWEFVALPLLDIAPDLIDDVSLTFNIGYLNSNFDSFPSCVLPEAANGSAIPGQPRAGFINCTGNTLTRAPPYTITLIADWPIDLGRWGTITPNFQFYASGKVWFRPTNCPVNPQCQLAVDTVSPPVVVNDDAQEAYQILDFRLTWTSADGHFDVAGFVNNLTDKDIIQSQVVGSAQIGAPVQVRFDRPRTWGIRFGMSW